MQLEVRKFFKDNELTDPVLIDKLFVSMYVYNQGWSNVRNEFIAEYILDTDHVQYSYFQKFKDLILKIGRRFDLEALVEFFEFVVSPKDKIVSGAVYTPRYIREYIVESVYARKSDLENSRTCDFASGCGGFLVTAAQILHRKTKKSYRSIFSENIFGLDIKDYSIARSKILLSLLAISEGEDCSSYRFNLYVGDALAFNWEVKLKEYLGFDYVIGNPPYVCSRNIDPSTQQHLSKWSVCSTGHPDLYIPFFQIGINNLKKDGQLGLITVNSFFKSLNGRALRKYFEEKSLQFRIIDFGTKQIFPRKSTYTCICLIKNTRAKGVEYKRWETDEPLSAISNFAVINYSSLNPHSGWNLENVDIIQRIESAGRPLHEIYTTRNGIATLKNSVYIFDPVDEDKKYYYLKNGDVYKIEKGICKDIVNPNKLASEENLKSLFEKLIFPYEFKGGRAEIYSAAFLKETYPFTYAYLEKKRELLRTRDKGKGEDSYEKWFAFGRRQCLEQYKFKLFFPHITSASPNLIVSKSSDLFFYNGICVVSENLGDVQILKKIMSSKIFWYYIKSTSKPYSAKFYSLSKNYIKNFPIPELTKEEKNTMLKEKDQEVIDQMLAQKYNLQDIVF